MKNSVLSPLFLIVFLHPVALFAQGLVELECQVTSSTLLNGKEDPKRTKRGSTTYSIDYDKKLVVDARGQTHGAEATNQLVTYKGSLPGPNGMPTVNITGRIDRLNGHIVELWTAAGEQGQVFSKIEGECESRQRRF